MRNIFVYAEDEERVDSFINMCQDNALGVQDYTFFIYNDSILAKLKDVRKVIKVWRKDTGDTEKEISLNVVECTKDEIGDLFVGGSIDEVLYLSNLEKNEILADCLIMNIPVFVTVNTWALYHRLIDDPKVYVMRRKS